MGDKYSERGFESNPLRSRVFVYMATKFESTFHAQQTGYPMGISSTARSFLCLSPDKARPVGIRQALSEGLRMPRKGKLGDTKWVEGLIVVLECKGNHGRRGNWLCRPRYVPGQRQ